MTGKHIHVGEGEGEGGEKGEMGGRKCTCEFSISTWLFLGPPHAAHTHTNTLILPLLLGFSILPPPPPLLSLLLLSSTFTPLPLPSSLLSAPTISTHSSHRGTYTSKAQFPYVPFSPSL